MSSMIVNDHHDARTREGIARPYRRLFIRRPGEDLSPSRRRFNMFKRSTLEAYSGVVGALTKSINHCMAGEEVGNSNDAPSQTGVVVGAVRVVDPHKSPILIPAPGSGTRHALHTSGNALKNLDELNDAIEAHLEKASDSKDVHRAVPSTVDTPTFASTLEEDTLPALQYVSGPSKTTLDSLASENEVNAAESTGRPGCFVVSTPGSAPIALSVHEQGRETDSHTACRTDRKESRVSSGTTQGSSSKASVPISSVSQDSTSSSLASLPDLKQTNPRKLQSSNNAEEWFFSEHLYRNVKVPRRRSICPANGEGATGRKDSARRMAELIQALDFGPTELASVAQNHSVESPMDRISAIHSSNHCDPSREEEPSSTHQEPHCMRQDISSAVIDSSLGQATANSSAVISRLALEVLAPDAFNTTISSSDESGATCAAPVDITTNHSSDETAIKASGDSANEHRLSRNSGQRPLRCRTRNQLNSIDDGRHSGLFTPIQGAIQVDGSKPEGTTSSLPTRPESSGSVSAIPVESPEVALRPRSAINPSGCAEEDVKSTHKKASIQVEVDDQMTTAPVSTAVSERPSSDLSDRERRLSSSEWLEHLQIGGSMLTVFVPHHRPLYTIEEQEEGEGEDEDEDEDEEEGDEVSLPSSTDSSAPVTPISGPFPLPGIPSEARSGSQAGIVSLLGSRRCGVRGTRRSDFGDGHPF